jgi:hypothetical protein
MTGQGLLIAWMLSVGQAQAEEPRFNAVGVSFDASVDTPGSLLGTYRPYGFKQGAWSVSTFMGLGDGVLRASRSDGEAVSVIDQVVSLVATGSYDLSKRVRVHTSVPVHTIVGSGDDVNGAAVGDLRLASHVVVLPPIEEAYGVSVGVVPFIDVPAGGGSRFLGEGALGGGIKLTATGALGAFQPTINIGYHGVGASDVDTLSAGSRLTSAVGLGWQSGSFGLSTEAHKQVRLGTADELGPGAAEWISSGTWRSEQGLSWVGGAALGLASGVGVPAYRVFVGVRTSMGASGATPTGPMPVVQAPVLHESSEVPEAPTLANAHPAGIAESPAVLPIWAVPRQP